MKRDEYYIQNQAEAFLLRLQIPFLHLTTAIKRVINRKFWIFPVEGMTGWPDLLIYLPHGRHLLVEFKSTLGKLSKDQVVVFADLEANGHPVQIIRSFDDFKDMILLNLGKMK